MPSSRTPALPPLYIEKTRAPTSPSTMSPDSFMDTTPLAPPHHDRKSSSGSTSSSSSSSSGYSYAARKQHCPPPKNVYTHCGRHTDQYLFGGKGFTDMWRAITKKE